MSKYRDGNDALNIAFLDLLSGALGAVIILFIAVPKHHKVDDLKKAKISMYTEKKVKKEKKTDGDIFRMLEKKEHDLNAKLELITKRKYEYLEIKNRLEKLVTGRERKVTEGRYIASAKNLDMGFKFNGRKIVIIINCSDSMIGEYKFEQVKAGLTMLVKMMSEDFQVEIISFPSLASNSTLQYLFGEVTNMTKINKLDIYNFIEKLQVGGNAPTREALRFTLAKYKNISDILLFSDGVPTKRFSYQKDDPDEIVGEISATNTEHVQLNTVGVGKIFLKDEISEQYRFLDILASENNGFFVSF